MKGDSEKKTIYFVWNYTNWGGAQIYMIAIMKLARESWNLRVMLPRDSPNDLISFLKEVPVEIEFLEHSLDNSTPGGIFDKIRRQFRRIRSESEIFQKLKRINLRHHILHIEAAPWQSWILLTALSLKGANIFITLHNFLPRASKWRMMIWSARLALVSRLPNVHFFASNRDTREKMRPWISEVSWLDTRLTYTAVNPEQIAEVLRDDHSDPELSINREQKKGKFIVLSVGQFIDRKGRWVLLDAARRVCSTDSQAIFIWLAPSIPDTGEMKIVEGYQLGDRFQIIRSAIVGTSRNDVLRFFLNADVFVLPSFVEGMPIALLEAMALGMPSISTNVYAIPEAIRHMETGVLVEAGDSSALAQNILLLKNDPVLRKRLGAAGRNFVLENFDERQSAKVAIAAYYECFQKAQPLR